MEDDLEDFEEERSYDRRESSLYVAWEKYCTLTLQELEAVYEYIQTPNGKKYAKDVRYKELIHFGSCWVENHPNREETPHIEEVLDDHLLIETGILKELIDQTKKGNHNYKFYQREKGIIE